MTTARQPQGIPTGGQFAAIAHAEPAIGLPNDESELDRKMRHHNNIMREIDSTLVTSSIFTAKQIIPDARELRLHDSRDAKFRGVLVPASITTEDGRTIPADTDDSSHAGWQHHTPAGAYLGSIEATIAKVSPHSPVWTEHPNCEYDPSTDETVVYLDGRRRHES